MKTQEDIIVKIAKALSDKTRVRIIKEVAAKGGYGLSCSDAEIIAGLSQPTVSHHIKILVDAGLLIAEKDGRCVMISVNKKTLSEFSAMVAGSFKG
jgi:ArsR family transcriptional regulator, arsenate/arsenite/antimonite-responsive transcriptional repressor